MEYPENHFKFWNKTEVNILLNMIQNNETLENISKSLKRTLPSINCKLCSIGIDMLEKGSSYEDVYDVLKINKNEIDDFKQKQKNKSKSKEDTVIELLKEIKDELKILNSKNISSTDLTNLRS